MYRFLLLGGLLAFICAAAPVRAGDFWQPDEQCYWCLRDAIYHDVKLINHLEANPDVDEAVKGPQIVAARADIHRLRVLLGPLQQSEPEPCCYARKPTYIR
jgi:hypothetical protein